MIILVKMALKGVVNANLCITARYDSGEHKLYVEVDDPIGQIYAKMQRNLEPLDVSVDRSSAPYP